MLQLSCCLILKTRRERKKEGKLARFSFFMTYPQEKSVSPKPVYPPLHKLDIYFNIIRNVRLYVNNTTATHNSICEGY